MIYVKLWYHHQKVNYTWKKSSVAWKPYFFSTRPNFEDDSDPVSHEIFIKVGMAMLDSRGYKYC